MIYKGDTGTRLEFELDNINFDDIDSAVINMLKPSGDKISKDMSKDDENKVLYYTTENEDFSDVGIYKIQIRITLSNGWSGSSDIMKIEVLDTI